MDILRSYNLGAKLRFITKPVTFPGPGRGDAGLVALLGFEIVELPPHSSERRCRRSLTASTSCSSSEWT